MLQAWLHKKIQQSYQMLVVVQLPGHVQLFMTPWTAACQAFLSLSVSQSLPKFMSVESVMPSNHLILFHHLHLLSSMFPSISVFSNESLVCIGCQSIGASATVLPKSIQGWFPLRFIGLISLLPKGLSRVFSSTTVRKYQFFGVLPLYCPALTCPYMTTRKTIALTIWTFVSKVMSLLFNTCLDLS